jgi:nitrite reductase (NADH) large subunit
VVGLGVAVRAGVRIERILRMPARLELVLAAGAGSLPADLVVVSAGIRPRDKLAAYAGLDCGPRGGICVDGQMRTSDPRIFAAGDCALYEGSISGLLAPGYRMADVLAGSLRGESPRFEGVDRTTRLKLLDIEVAAIGQFQATGRAVVHRSPGGYRKLIAVNGRLIGALGVGPWPGVTELQRKISGGERLWPWQRRRFVRTGELAARTAPVRALPRTAVVCHCLGVTRGALERAMLGGCRTVASLATATGASTACGGCRPDLGSLLGQSVAAVPITQRRLLSGASAGAALALGAWLLSGPVTPTNTVQRGWHLEQLWRSGTARQITGYTLLALVAGALLLSGRKRTRLLGQGNFGWWRTIHAGMGAMTLLAVAVHTGLRGGDNLNRALLVGFLIMNAAGAVTGALAAGTGPEAIGSWQRTIRTGHVALFWLVLPLLLFHIVAVYWF